ncbi:PemK-like protein [Candidatus Methanoperedens nitroreducens]|uniref:PemK-like protein n=1 Tax=Candidatus Methanoperedens nitratireducens TaxID=1392998 RepID=A0A062VA50_9EURY|nr:type II toxin-antitoxin system PemK/MazF family toxin [Candidatus Methanoperedens nitroreducens]KCZ72220.1 PemK-like protein [Candidatus Methanoperedens nitroreducens]MDJ1421802.1 type II toxin-antitoxin system PemK/MazF family toxin [Candidatus Methanoperedens sp.]
MKGKIVLVPFPFTDLTAVKLRPALVIYEGREDVILAFISSKIQSDLSEVDVLVTKNHKGFRRAGLKVDSIIKLDKIATVLKDLIVGELGELDEELKNDVNQKLKKIMEI